MELTISELVSLRRKRQGLNQRMLAELSGVSLVAIRRIESDENAPRIGELEQIAIALRCTLSVDFIDNEPLQESDKSE